MQKPKIKILILVVTLIICFFMTSYVKADNQVSTSSTLPSTSEPATSSPSSENKNIIGNPQKVTQTIQTNSSNESDSTTQQKSVQAANTNSTTISSSSKNMPKVQITSGSIKSKDSNSKEITISQPDSSEEAKTKSEMSKSSSDTGALGTSPWVFADGTLTLGTGAFNLDGSTPSWYYQNYASIQHIVITGPLTLTGSMYALFAGYPNLVDIQGLSYLNTSNITNMYELFENDGNLQTLDLSSFNTANTTNMTAMFANDFSLQSINMTSFDTQKVTSMKAMFAGDSSLKVIDLSNFDMTNNVGTLNMLSTGDYPPKVLILGQKTVLADNMNLPYIEEDDNFTGNWQNIGQGSGNNPLGKFVFDSGSLMDNYDGAIMAGVYVWQPLDSKRPLLSSPVEQSNNGQKSSHLIHHPVLNVSLSHTSFLPQTGAESNTFSLNLLEVLPAPYGIKLLVAVALKKRFK